MAIRGTPFPVFAGMEETIECRVLIKVGDNISTDIIMPAGNRVLPFRSNIPADYDSLAQSGAVRFPGMRSAILSGKSEIVVEAGGLLNLAKKGS